MSITTFVSRLFYLSEKLKCDKCGKMFGNLQILQLHLRFHDASQTADKTLDIAGSVTSSGVKSTNCCQQQSLDLAREIISARHRINELTKIPPENDGKEILTDNEKEIETQKTNKMAESETVEIPPVYTPRKKRKTGQFYFNKVQCNPFLTDHYGTESRSDREKVG